MTDKPHTPTTQTVERTYVTYGRVDGPLHPEERRAEFFRWLTAHDESIRAEERENIAAAEQRGAERGWDEAMTAQIQRLISGDPDVERFQMPANPYRADQMEGDNE